MSDDRRTHTMTTAEFEAMGGLEPPQGFDPDTRVHGHLDGALGKDKARQGVKYQTTTIYKISRNPTADTGYEWAAHGPKPSSQEALTALAAAHGVRMLTIHWPTRHLPEFSAKDDPNAKASGDGC